MSSELKMFGAEFLNELFRNVIFTLFSNRVSGRFCVLRNNEKKLTTIVVFSALIARESAVIVILIL